MLFWVPSYLFFAAWTALLRTFPAPNPAGLYIYTRGPLVYPQHPIFSIIHSEYLLHYCDWPVHFLLGCEINEYITLSFLGQTQD